MAGQSLRASAPSAGAPLRPILNLPGTTRTRHSHGAFPLGELMASVYSSRREHDGRVTLVVGRETLHFDVCMSPAQARAMARILDAAAKAADAGLSAAIESKGGAA